MTSPLQFPTLQPPQAVATPHPLDGFAELLLNMRNHQQTIALERERLADQKKRTEADIKSQAAGDVRAGMKTAADLRKELKDADEHDKALQGAKLGTDAATLVFAAHGGPTDENVQAARIKLIKGTPGPLMPMALSAFEAHLKDAAQTTSTSAEARLHTTEADVAGATKQDRIDLAKASLAHMHESLTLTKLQEANERARLRFGDSRDPGQAMEHGVPAGTAYRLKGLPLPAGIDPNYTFPGTSKKTEAQTQAEGMLGMFRDGLALVNSVGAAPLTLMQTWRQRTDNNIVAGAANLMSTSKQQQLFRGYEMMATAFTFGISGKQSAVAEQKRMAALLTPIAGDKPETQIATMRLWSAVDANLAKAAGFEVTPTQAMDNIIQTAKAAHVSKDKMAILLAQRADAKTYEESPAYTTRKTQSTTSPDLLGDPVVRTRLTVRP